MSGLRAVHGKPQYSHVRHFVRGYTREIWDYRTNGYKHVFRMWCGQCFVEPLECAPDWGRPCKTCDDLVARADRRGAK